MMSIKQTGYEQPLRYPNHNLHRALLVASTGLSIASLIPATRQVASMMLRSIAFISSTAICADSWEKETPSARLLNITRIGIVTLGIVGIASAKPAIFVAALAAEVGLQAIELGKAIYEKDNLRALTHFGVLVIDSLMLAAVVTGSWQVMVTAAAVNAFAMFIFIHKVLDHDGHAYFKGGEIDAACYIILGLTSIASSVQALSYKIVKRSPPVSGHYEITNKYDKEMEITRNQRYVATLKPGESISFDVKYKHGVIFSDELQVYTQLNKSGCNIPDPDVSPVHIDYNYHVYEKLPLNPKFYSTVPIGGTILVDRTLT